MGREGARPETFEATNADNAWRDGAMVLYQTRISVAIITDRGT